MPEENSRVHIYFPDHDEQSAIAVHAIGSGSTSGGAGAGGGGGKSPDNKRFSDPSGSAMDMTPGQFSFTSDAGGASTLFLSGSGSVSMNGNDISIKAQKGMMAGEGEDGLAEHLIICGGNKVSLSIGDGGADLITLDTEANIISAFIKQTADLSPAPEPSAASVEAEITANDEADRTSMNEAVKNDMVAKKQESKQKILKGLKSIVTVIAVTALVVCTGGAALPFALAAGAKAVFAVADMAEGISGYNQLGALDNSRPANFLRDTIFGGNEALYDLASAATDIIFDLVSGKALKGKNVLKNMDKLFCKGGKVVNMVAKTGVQVIGGMIEDYMVTGKINPLNVATNFGIGMLKGSVGSWAKGSIVSKLGLNSKAAQKLAGTFVGATIDTGLDVVVDGFMGQKTDVLQAFSQNLLANGLAEYFGEPMDAATGGFLIRATDFIFSNYRESIRIGRTYNSSNHTVGILGKGWVFPYEGRFYKDENQCHVVLDTGHHLIFAWNEGQFQNKTPGCGWFTLQKEEEEFRLYDRKNHKEYRYNQQGRLTSIRDQNGQAMIFAYHNDNLEQITTALGYELQLSYREGRLVQMTDHIGRTMQYQYQEGLLSSVVHMSKGITRYTYDSMGYLIKTTDQSGVTYLENQYDYKGRVILQTLANGDTYQAKYVEEERKNYITSSISQETILYEYGKKGEICRISYKDGTHKVYEYSEDGGYRTKEIDRLGNAVSFVYDEAGRILEEHKPEGLRTTSCYDEEDNLRVRYDTAGREWRYQYDDRHNRITEEEKSGDEKSGDQIAWITKSYHYDQKGRLLAEIDAMGQEKKYRYEEAYGSPTVVCLEDGTEVVYEYDAIGRKMAEEDSYGRTEYGYNAGNYRNLVRNPLGQETRWMYDGAGRMLAMYPPKAWKEQAGEYSYRYDFLDRLIDTIRPDQSHERQFRDGEGNILKKVHPNTYQKEQDDGEGTTYDYDGDGNQIRIHYPDGGCERFFYDANGNRIKHILPEYYQSAVDDGEGYQYTYDSAGRLIQVLQPTGQIEAAFTYDLMGNVLTESDALGQTTYYTYNLQGNLLEVLRPSKEENQEILYQKIAFTYDENQNRTQENRFGGYWNRNGDCIQEEGETLTLSFAYDSRNRLILVKDGLGAVIRYRYDGRGNRTYEEKQISEDVKQVLHYTYYPNGYLKEQKEELNSGLASRAGEPKFAITQYEYDENGNRTRILTPEGYEIQRTYDCCDRLLTERSLDTANGIDRTVKVTYDAAGNITKVLRQGKDGEPWEIQYDYDLKDRIIHVGDCLGPVFQYEYDQNDRLIKEILPQADAKKQNYPNAYEYQYNERGEVLVQRDSTAVVLEKNIYQTDGRIASKSQSNGNEILFSYDVFGNEREITTTRSREKGVAAQRYHYDSRGRITGVVNGNQHTTGYDMDHWGRITKTHNPDEGKEQYTYNFAGNITSTTDANGNVITYRYNSQGKVCEIMDQDGNAEQFYYDREGRLSLSIDRLGTKRKCTYNMDANLLLETATDHREKLQETRSYEYDSMGNLKKAVAGGFLYQYRYRPDGKLLEKTSSGKPILTCTYHADGSLKTLTDATGKTVCYGYDYRGKLERITDETGLEIVHYTHYADGNLKEIRHFNGIKTLYEYDTDGNITRLATLFPNGSALCDLRYAYDLNGNRTAKAGSRLMAGKENILAANIRYRYDSMNRLLEEEDHGEIESYQYDLCGNRLFHKTIDGEEWYQYNNRNQLTHRSGADGSISYTYNAQGNITTETSIKGTTTYGYNLFNRQSKVEMADGQTLESIYDGEGLRAGTVQNGKASTFFYFNGELLGEKQEEQTNRMILGYGVAASEVSGKTGYHAYHSDEQLSTGYITNAEQGVENRYTYNAFGEVREKEENIHNRILYTGQQYDQVTGQYYLRARFYNPVVGRFLQEDEYRGDGLNLYAYCGNNPVVYYDPSGYESLPDWLKEYFKKGNDFNKDYRPNYPYNEVRVTKDGKEYRVDSYKPSGYDNDGNYIKGQIVSRKYTQFGDVQEKTAISYLNEARKKYSPGTDIIQGDFNSATVGKMLSPDAELILQVPKQNVAIPDNIQKKADALGIRIEEVPDTVKKREEEEKGNKEGDKCQ